MNVKRMVIVVLLVMLCVVIMSGCNSKKAQLEKELAPYTEMLQNGSISELEMTIYYINPTVFTTVPLGADALKSYRDVHIITVSGEKLSEQIDLLKELSADNLQLTSSKYLDARFCFEFSNASGDVLLTFAFWGEGNSVYVNGIAVEENEIFYKLLIPYIPEEDIKQILTKRLTKLKG